MNFFKKILLLIGMVIFVLYLIWNEYQSDISKGIISPGPYGVGIFPGEGILGKILK